MVKVDTENDGKTVDNNFEINGDRIRASAERTREY